MNPSRSAPPPGDRAAHLGPALRRAWIGYQQRVDAAMADAGFADRSFPDGRVLRMCRDTPGTTIADIGRALGITRQGASKLVAGLRERGYVTVQSSATSGREKTITITPKAVAYLQAQRAAARRIERRIQRAVGDAAFTNLLAVLDELGGAEQPRMREYLRARGLREL